MKSQGEVRSLVKALTALKILATADKDMDLGALSSRTGFPKSTLVRLLATLKAHGFVFQDPETRRYRLGWALIHLGKEAKRQLEFPVVLRPFLEQLSRETGETASLGILDGYHAIYVDQVASNSIIKGAPPVGTPLELHCTAVGKVLLSTFSEEELERFIREKGLPALTEHTITNAAQLRRELETVRKRGYAVDNEEAERGGRCVAAPVYDATGKVVAAMSIVGPTNRITLDRLEDYASIVRHVAYSASKTLGFLND